jgi:hypothetical protein
MTAAGITPVQAQRPRSPLVPPPTSPSAPPLNAKVQETLMGPRIQNGRGPVAYMSEDGDHLAVVAPKGSRQVMLIDGVEGPVFDEIPLNSVWNGSRQSAAMIVFSPTGGRSAYVARRAGDFIAVVDGKEAFTLQTPATASAVSYGTAANWTFLFNHDGSRLAYAAQEAGGWVMIVDGVKSPAYRAIDFTMMALNGKHLLYVAQSADQKWHAVVDGKSGPGYEKISGLKVTTDGAHYAFLVNRFAGSTAGKPGAAAVIDGVESPWEQDISDLEQAPDGRVSYMAMRPQTGPGGNPPHLIAGGLDITWTTTFGTGASIGNNLLQYHVAWSPDGKRFACIKMNNPNPGVTVLVNGKPMGPAYRSANMLMWSADGAHLAYQAVSESGTFFVLDGEESSGYDWIKEFQWSPDGKRYAYYAGTSTAITMIVDGKEQPKAMGFGVGSPRFSPDGKHFAYGAQTNVAGFQPMVDGVVKPQNLGNFATRVPGNLPVSIPQFFFSADGNHLAYVGQRTDGSGKTPVWVDGVAQQGPQVGYFHPAWSPDGKHFAVVGSSGGDPRWAIMLDGKFGPAFEDILVLNEASARFVTPHTYRYYTFKGTDIYRVTLEVGM